MTEVIRIAHLRIAHQAAITEAGNSEIHWIIIKDMCMLKLGTLGLMSRALWSPEAIEEFSMETQLCVVYFSGGHAEPRIVPVD